MKISGVVTKLITPF